MEERHDCKVIRVTDPYLGKVYAVECPWCGVFGRFDLRQDAANASVRHTIKRGFERRGVGG